MIKNIPIAKIKLNKNEISSVISTLESGWLVQGPKVKEFEKRWSNFTGSKFSIAVTSCTTAMQLSLIALNFRPGDEAIVPSFTWISTANVVEQLGGKVIFCDIDINTFNIDTKQIESKISSKTKFILPVHLFGYPADMKKILQISKKYNLKIVEDAACGFGSIYKKQHVGLLGDTGCFSFHPRKSITTGEGGMITTQSKDLYDNLLRLRDHGASLSDHQRHKGPKPYLLSDHLDAGYNARMTDIQAALGAEQMKRADTILKERQKIAMTYYEGLHSCKDIILPPQNKYLHNSFQSFPCLLKLKSYSYGTIKNTILRRNIIMEKLQSVGISTRPATHSVISLTYYKKK